MISCKILYILAPTNPMEVVTWHLLFEFSSKEGANCTSVCWWKKLFEKNFTNFMSHYFKMYPVHSKNKTWTQIQVTHLNSLFRSNINFLVSPTITLSGLPLHLSAGRAYRLYHQGVTVVVHGYLFMHWATIWVKCKETYSPPYAGEFRVEGNTPDFMLEHFITFCCITFVALFTWEVDTRIKAIQQTSC